jgi:hypothetical protein
MSGRNWCAQQAIPAAILALLLGTAGAYAQTIGPDEPVNANGAVAQHFGLTDAQKRAIYNAVLQQRVRGSNATIPVAVGAPVPRAAALSDLPDGAIAAQPLAMDLKYAMVENDVVVVDSLRMRVIEIIHGGTRP